LYTATLEYIVCGDINIDYVTDSDRKCPLDALLITCNLTSAVNFPTRIQKKSATATDNIFIDISKMGNYSIFATINGISDHDAQLLALHSYNLRPLQKKHSLIRNINDHTINYFLTKLSYETCHTVLSTDDVNIMFNSFLDTYLKMFHSTFQLKRVCINKNIKLDFFGNFNVL
jgi:hypothetical protein